MIFNNILHLLMYKYLQICWSNKVAVAARTEKIESSKEFKDPNILSMEHNFC